MNSIDGTWRSQDSSPTHTLSPVIMHSFSDNNITLETTTTSNDNPEILIELMTPNPQAVDIQEIVRQSLIRTHSALVYIRQHGRPLNKPLYFSDIQEQLEGTGLILNPLGDNTTDTT